MSCFFAKSRLKGFLAVLVVILVLFLIFAVFGRFPEDEWKESAPIVNRVGMGSQKSYALKYYKEEMPRPTSAQATSALAEDTADNNAYEGVGYGGTEKVEAQFSEAMSESDISLDRKIIKEGSTYIETRDFDHSLEVIDQMIVKSGGFTEKKDISGNSYNTGDLRHATIVFRVPSDQFETIMENMGSVGVVTRSNTSGTDITDQYIDSETRLRNLKVQEETLLDILSKTEKLEDVIALESRISEVRYEIESIENQLKNYDRLVQYSRISVELQEVVETSQVAAVPRTLGDRIANAFWSAIDSFAKTMENFVVWLVYNWILLALILVAAAVLIIVARRRKKRKKGVTTVVIESEVLGRTAHRDKRCRDPFSD